MAKTLAISCQQMSDWQHVSYALHCAARGKMQHRTVQAALQSPELTISRVSHALKKGQLPCGNFHSFEIFDPKRRIIHAAPFLDRIAHHAIVLFLEPVFERMLLPSVFACRPNKGVHKAVYYAQKQSRRFRWVMHIDIKHYFPNIDHAILKQQLRKCFKGDGLRLLDEVIDAHSVDNNAKGLPIGSLTSQHFANHYLNSIDRWSLAQPGIKAHCRYMDDFLFWADSKKDLLAMEVSLREKLSQTLKLTIKPPVIQKTKQALLFCGIHIRPFQLKASARRKRRYLTAWKKWEDQWQQGKITSLELQNSFASACAILLPAEENPFRRNQFKRLGFADA